jgi:hypothetical protein
MPEKFAIYKDPNAVLDYRFDWQGDDPGPWLADAETISTSTWTVPTGITKDSDSKTDTTATIWLSGGTAGVTYDVVNRITTSAGRTEDRTLQVVCVER